jgi:hypothetical protein
LDIKDVTSGVIFMFSSWSPTIVQLRNLVNYLQDFPSVRLYFYNIDERDFLEFKNRNCLHSNGWGETYWIKNGKIVAEEEKYDSRSIDVLIHNNNSIK